MTHQEIRQKFLDFFKQKGHTIVVSSSLLPDDPSVLFTTAGMQQFKKYYTGEADPMADFKSLNTVSIQKCIRTSDIDEVGDNTHHTFLEMLGNFSFGGYFKKEAITWAHEFITKELHLPISYVTVFEGLDSAGVPKDEESKEIWRSLGVNDVREELWDVFWGPTGNSGPCGPTTEIYCRNAQGEDVEIWNIVFNEFFCEGSRDELLAGTAKLKPLPKKGIDTGMGLERLAMISQGKSSNYDTDLFKSIIALMPTRMEEREKRISADHARAITFIIADGVRPSNKDRGYVLRRLIRRLIVHTYNIGSIGSFRGDDIVGVSPDELIGEVVKQYQNIHGKLDLKIILQVFDDEWSKFQKTAGNGLRELSKIESVNATTAFKLYESFGLPYEIIKDVGKDKAAELTREAFDLEFKKHQEISRAGLEKKFGGHGLLLDTGELKAASEEELKKVTRLHTATHMLQQALRMVLGEQVHQAGSDITVERTRFDFTFDRKLTLEEIKKVEDIVNEKIAEDLPMQKIVLPKAEAEKTGALYFFKEKYPDPVNVYFVGKTLETAFSKEFCGGPHVEHTGTIGKFKIIKEEAVGAGVRRIRATVE